MKISKLFHWLYAFLMFIPLFFVLAAAMSNWGTGNEFTTSDVLNGVIGALPLAPSGLFSTLHGVVSYMGDIFGVAGALWFSAISRLMTYWLTVSIMWMLFDVFMFVPQLCHRLIDKAYGSVEK